MKKFAFILVAAGAFAFASCNQAEKAADAAGNVDSMANAATSAVSTDVDSAAAKATTTATAAVDSAAAAMKK